MIDMNKEVHVLVDANSYVHSAFNGHEPKFDKKGVDQRVLWGLVEMLVSLTYQLERIDSIFVIFDPKDNYLYRKSKFPAYKANRPPTDPELERQREDAKFILTNKIGIPNIHFPGYEADDIIGSLAYHIASEKKQVIIVSPDKDMMQLINKNIFIMKKRRKKGQRGYEFLGEKEVKDNYGVNANQIADWLALMGDAVDNLPGLDKVGEKTAAKILSVYPSVEHLLSIIGHMEDKKIEQKVIEGKDLLPLIKNLTTIVTNLPVIDIAKNELIKMNKIRNDNNYMKTLEGLEKYFGWPLYFKEVFKM